MEATQPRPGILEAIQLLGEANKGKTDKDTHKMISEILIAIQLKKRNVWPSKDLRTLFNQLDPVQKKYFIEVLQDMKLAMDEAYGDLT